MKQALNLAKKLISIPSTSNNPEALNEVLEICKKELSGFNYKEFESDGIKSLLFYNTPSLPEKFRLILNGHLDVVQGKNDQYKVREEEGRLYGRGSYDMKVAAAVMILVFKELAKKVDYPLGLQLVTDEEIGGLNGTKYQIEKGVRADFVIAGENTNLKINNISKGIIWLEVKTKGKSAHGAYPWLGENAIWKMHKVLSKIEKLYPIPEEEIWCTTASLSMINSSNKTFNKVADECIASFDIRYIPEDKDKVIDILQKELGQDVEIKTVLEETDQFTDESNIYMQKLGETIKEVTGEEAELIKKHGASDIRHYNLVGCDGITFGITGAGHHGDSEWVDIKSIENYYTMLKNFLLRIN